MVLAKEVGLRNVLKIMKSHGSKISERFDHGLNPRDCTGLQGTDGDPDADGLVNLDELIHGTHPLISDTDGDTVNDGDEVDQGSDPNDKTDGGQKPPTGSIVEVPFTVGDPSGSHSERWKMTI